MVELKIKKTSIEFDQFAPTIERVETMLFSSRENAERCREVLKKALLDAGLKPSSDGSFNSEGYDYVTLEISEKEIDEITDATEIFQNLRVYEFVE